MWTKPFFTANFWRTIGNCMMLFELKFGILKLFRREIIKVWSLSQNLCRGLIDFFHFIINFFHFRGTCCSLYICSAQLWCSWITANIFISKKLKLVSHGRQNFFMKKKFEFLQIPACFFDRWNLSYFITKKNCFQTKNMPSVVIFVQKDCDWTTL